MKRNEILLSVLGRRVKNGSFMAEDMEKQWSVANDALIVANDNAKGKQLE